MKKILFAVFATIAIAMAFSVCAMAETVFETEKRILCEDINNSEMGSTTMDNSYGDRVFFTYESNITTPEEIKSP